MMALTERTDAEAWGARSTLWQWPTGPLVEMEITSPLMPWRMTRGQGVTLVRDDRRTSICRDAPLSRMVFEDLLEEVSRHVLVDLP